MVVIYVRIRLVILDKFLITNCKTNIVANNIFILGLFASSSHKHNSMKSKSISSKQFMFDAFFGYFALIIANTKKFHKRNFKISRF